MENNSQQLDQLLKGVYRLCVNMDECYGCPFYKNKCVFGEPKPKTWFDEDSIHVPVTAHTPVSFVAEAEHDTKPDIPKADDDSNGTWILSTSMGSVFSKYVFICSKCGYKKESVLALTPMSTCPECEKRKAIRNFRNE
ncbi:MAG: hypothetical protein K5869_01720 [Saccharofermentans sp.]|nr:hypothetical protein [Saccharofermentans sp.]